MEKLIREWDGEYVISRFDQPTQTWMFIAIHSTALGVATGGTRLKSYDTPKTALRDALRLAQGMTRKFAVIDFPRGGAKAVLAVPGALSPSQREGLMSRYGKWLADLNGVFETGADLGTASGDMDVIARHYPGVFGKSPENSGAGDPGPETALGVFHGIQASCAHYFKSEDLYGLRILVQGAGSVGQALMRRLINAGCEVKFSDVDSHRVEKIQQELKLPFVQPQAVLSERCEVFSPCAVGGILNENTIPQLSCRVVAGSANNQLEREEDGERLHQCGILYAPDYVINAGGAIFLPAVEGWGWSVERARKRIIQIGETLKQIYHRADAQTISSARAAEQLALERLQKGRSEKD